MNDGCKDAYAFIFQKTYNVSLNIQFVSIKRFRFPFLIKHVQKLLKSISIRFKVTSRSQGTPTTCAESLPLPPTLSSKKFRLSKTQNYLKFGSLFRFSSVNWETTFWTTFIFIDILYFYIRIDSSKSNSMFKWLIWTNWTLHYVTNLLKMNNKSIWKNKHLSFKVKLEYFIINWENAAILGEYRASSSDIITNN